MWFYYIQEAETFLINASLSPDFISFVSFSPIPKDGL